MKKILPILRREIFVIVYVLLIFLILLRVGEVNKITTYNVSAVSSLKSSHLLTEYKEEPKVEQIKSNVYKYRVTSYYPGDECNSTNCTGTGLCTKDFQVDEHGWYTYNGKLVLAAATTYLQNQFGVKENKLYFKYYDEVLLTIDGVQYEGIILDTCGACYRNEIVDLFVTNKESVLDRGYLGYNMVSMEVTKKK